MPKKYTITPTISMRKAEAVIGGRMAILEIADTDTKRRVGLSGRTHIANDHGMLFDPGTCFEGGFWMSGVNFPLSIAFVDSNARITSVHEMMALSESVTMPYEPWRWAIEMPSGWLGEWCIGKSLELLK